MHQRAARSNWEALGEQSEPSWYLDPLVAQQKRQVHLDLIQQWRDPSSAPRILKTDLFEEAFGHDHLLPALAPHAAFACGIDEAFSTARAAHRRSPGCPSVAADVRRLPLAPASFDLVLSTSTLDHFTNPEDFRRAISELHRVLRPGALLILTLDNPSNPLYPPLRWLSRTRFAPFFLGYSPAMPQLQRILLDAGFEVERTAFLLHNPRLLSTLMTLLCRRLLGRFASPVIAFHLRAFALLHHLPTRRFTACFHAVAARKPAA